MSRGKLWLNSFEIYLNFSLPWHWCQDMPPTVPNLVEKFYICTFRCTYGSCRNWPFCFCLLLNCPKNFNLVQNKMYFPDRYNTLLYLHVVIIWIPAQKLCNLKIHQDIVNCHLCNFVALAYIYIDGQCVTVCHIQDSGDDMEMVWKEKMENYAKKNTCEWCLYWDRTLFQTSLVHLMPDCQKETR